MVEDEVWYMIWVVDFLNNIYLYFHSNIENCACCMVWWCGIWEFKGNNATFGALATLYCYIYLNTYCAYIDIGSGEVSLRKQGHFGTWVRPDWWKLLLWDRLWHCGAKLYWILPTLYLLLLTLCWLLLTLSFYRLLLTLYSHSTDFYRLILNSRDSLLTLYWLLLTL